MRRKMSRRNQRGLEREMFGPARTPRPRPERQPSESCCLVNGVLTPLADLPKDKIGACRFCANHTELGYRRDTWTCFMCGGVYVTSVAEIDAEIAAINRTRKKIA